MIPVQELRIGNYVLWQGKIVEVISIMPRWALTGEELKRKEFEPKEKEE